MDSSIIERYMTTNFMHFAYMNEVPKIELSAEDFAEQINNCLRDMIESGKESGELILEIPDNLSEEQAMIFIDEIMKRLQDMQDDSDE